MKHKGTDGATYRRGPQINKGGGGTVYEVVGDPSRCMKLFHEPISKAVADKLAMQLRLTFPAPAEPNIQICWPICGILGPDGKRLIGFVMPRVPKGAVSLNKVMRRSKREGKHLTYDVRILIAALLAKAVHHFHSHGIIVGDLNELNALVDLDTATLYIIDADSVQFSGPRGKNYACPLGRPQYVAPELHGKDLATVVRDQASDRWALSVLVFQLLMEGFEPMAGAPTSPATRPQTLEQRQVSGQVPIFGGAPGFGPPPGAPSIDTMPDSIQRYLKATLATGAHSPQARLPLVDLIAALRDGKDQLVTCSGPGHRIPAGRRSCPWCAWEKTGRPRRAPSPSPIITPAPTGQPVRVFPPQTPAPVPTPAPVIVPGRGPTSLPPRRPMPTPSPATSPATWLGQLGLRLRTVYDNARRRLSMTGRPPNRSGWRRWIPANPMVRLVMAATLIAGIALTTGGTGPSSPADANTPPLTEEVSDARWSTEKFYELYAEGRYDEAYEMTTAQFQEEQPQWVRGREQAWPHIAEIEIGDPEVTRADDGNLVAAVPVSFVIRNRSRVTWADQYCRELRGTASLSYVPQRDQWDIHPPLNSQMSGDIVPPSNRGCS